jgi:murein DD-endopeptidase MepM/ murein hydrolase activator NlpD
MQRLAIRCGSQMAWFLHLRLSMRSTVLAVLIGVFLLPHAARADIRICERAAALLRSSEGVETIEDMISDLLVVRPRALRPGFILPTEGRISSLFGARRDPLTRVRAFHEGIDIAHGEGALVRAASNGTIARAGWMGGCGIGVTIDHGRGLSTRYCHLAALEVHGGDSVAMGESIGRMGSTGRSTGSHLHFELRDHGMAIDPTERLFY